jgi:hypothetical protein
VDESVAMDEAEVKLKNSIAPKLTNAPPAPKVARYLQDSRVDQIRSRGHSAAVQ